MKARRFNSIMPSFNEEWAADVLKMKRNISPGPDLIDEDKVVEVKFRLYIPESLDPVVPNREYVKWAILGYQMNYNQLGKPAYWALGTYQLDRRVSEIKEKDIERLENFVERRELWVVPWEWMDRFAEYHNSGETESSKWDNLLRHPKKSQLPKNLVSLEVNKGKLHFTEGVDLGDFQNIY